MEEAEAEAAKVEETPIWLQQHLYKGDGEMRWYLVCPYEMKEVALDPKVQDWCLNPHTMDDGVLCYVLDSTSQMAGIKPRFAFNIINGKKASPITDKDRLDFINS